MIEFKVWAMKADTNKLHTNLFIKEEYMTKHYQDNTGIFTYSSSGNTQRVKSSNNIS